MIGTTVTAMSRRWNCGLTAVAIDNSATNLATRRFVVNAGTPAELAKRTRLGRPAVSRSREPTALVAGSPTFSSSSSSGPDRTTTRHRHQADGNGHGGWRNSACQLITQRSRGQMRSALLSRRCHMSGDTRGDSAGAHTVYGGSALVAGRGWRRKRSGSSQTLRGEPSGWVRVAVRPGSSRSRPRSSSAAPS
jgi:hypothetical protein